MFILYHDSMLYIFHRISILLFSLYIIDSYLNIIYLICFMFNNFTIEDTII